MKKVVAIVVAALLIFAGSVFTILAVDAGLDLTVDQIAINAAGDNSKAMQKANDSKKHLDSIRQKWIGYSCTAVASYFVSLAIIVTLIVKLLKSKNVRE